MHGCSFGQKQSTKKVSETSTGISLRVIITGPIYEPSEDYASQKHPAIIIYEAFLPQSKKAEVMTTTEYYFRCKKHKTEILANTVYKTVMATGPKFQAMEAQSRQETLLPVQAKVFW